MKSFEITTESRIIRWKERDLLKTKIVATIGRPPSENKKTTYEKGIFDLQGRTISPLTYERLVTEFYNRGVDVIRLNLSHLGLREIKGAFREIKKAILKCEQGKKKIALLADLPGPKIRFDFGDSPLTFKVGQSFTVHFEKRVLSESEATVYVDGNPLKKALSGKQRRGGTPNRKIRLHNTPAFVEGVEPADLVKNVLGDLFVATEEHVDEAFQVMMAQIKTRLSIHTEERVLAIIGDGDVIMEVETLGDLKKAALGCKIVAIKGAKFDSAQKRGAGQCTLDGKRGFTLKGVDFDIASFNNIDHKKVDALLNAEYEGFKKPDWTPVVAFIAVSFAQTADDILRAKEYIESKLLARWHDPEQTRLNAPSIIAKIETNKGWENKNFILDVTDGVMVARGDLGLQMDIEEVPAIQKRLILLCKKRGKPVITATEMLKSMTESIEPTRAEGTDVFNAIVDGSDAVMMSEETSKGQYPLNAIEKMISIAVRAERYFERRDMDDDMRRRTNLLRYQEFLNDDFERIDENTRRFRGIIAMLAEGKAALSNAHLSPSTMQKWKDRLDWRQRLLQEKLDKSLKQRDTNRITQATCTLSEGEDIRCILAASTTGRTVRMISRLRPSVLLIGAAHDAINTRKLAISYGVLPICIDEVNVPDGTDGVFESFESKLAEDNFLNNSLRGGDTVIFTAGTPLREPGTTNLIQMRTIKLAAEPNGNEQRETG